MTRSTDEQEKRLAQLKREVTKRGFDRHISVLKNISDLPVDLRSPAMTTLITGEAIQNIIDFPPQIQHGWQYVPRQALLFTPTDVIHLLASIWPDQHPRITFIKGHGLMYMRATLLLLYGFLEIVAHGQTSPTRLGMEFSTVAWPCLSVPLRRLLQVAKVTPGMSTTQMSYSPTAQQALEKLPLKFSNGVKIYGLLPGEQLEELVFQPGLWRRWLHFFRRPVTANTLLMLTSNFMAVIQEELKVAQGWILSYIPRNCIAEMQSKTHGLYNELIVQLKRGDQKAEYKLLLTSEAVEAWRLRWIGHGGQWLNLPESTVT